MASSNHRPYNLDGTPPLCNVVVKDAGINETFALDG